MLPGGDIITWPVRIFVTYVHESMHAIAALISGGSVESISVRPDFSGTAMTIGGSGWLISSAGYVGTTLVGAGALYLLRTGVPSVIIVGGYLMLCLFSAIYTGFYNIYGTVVALGLAVLFFAALQWFTTIVAAFVSVQLLLNSFYDLKTLLILSSTSSTHTDAQNMEMATGIPATVWALIWIGFSCILTYFLLFRGNGNEN